MGMLVPLHFFPSKIKVLWEMAEQFSPTMMILAHTLRGNYN
jgi:hypothetical protein